MKDIEDKLAAFLMDYGVLKNADAEKMAKRIAGMFEKEREELKAQLRAWECNATYSTNLGIAVATEQLQKERAQLAAKCAAYKQVIQLAWEDRRDDSDVEYIGKLAEARCNADCGKGWLSPEKAQRLRGGLERMAGYAATVRLDRRKVIDDCVMCLQTEDWCNGLLERVEESGKVLSETK